MNSREMNKKIKTRMGLFFFEDNPLNIEDWRGLSPYELLKRDILGENYTEASEKRFDKVLTHVMMKILGIMSPKQVKEFRKRMELE